MTEIVTRISENEWNKFLRDHNISGLGQTPEWKKFIESTFGYRAYYLFTKDENGDVSGIFPLFHVKSNLTGKRLVSVPFSQNSGPVGSDDAVRALLDEGLKLYERLDADYFEIRDGSVPATFQKINSYSTYILNLSPNMEEVWKKLNKGSVRRYIEKSKSLGVSVERTDRLEDLKDFYEINCMNKRDIGVPCHPWKFFTNLLAILSGKASLYVSKHDGRVIGGGIMTYYGDCVSYGYGAAHPGYLKFYPYYAFIWKSIEDACKGGYLEYDFGRTSYDNSGLTGFKKRWGTIEKKLYYSFYPHNPGSVVNDRGNIKYRLGTRAFRHMPMGIYKKVSDMAFSHFG